MADNSIIPPEFNLEARAREQGLDAIIDLHLLRQKRGTYYTEQYAHSADIMRYADLLGRTLAPEENEFRASNVAHESIYHAFTASRLLVAHEVELDCVISQDFYLHMYSRNVGNAIRALSQEYLTNRPALHRVVREHVKDSSVPLLAETVGALTLKNVETYIEREYIRSEIESFRSQLADELDR